MKPHLRTGITQIVKQFLKEYQSLFYGALFLFGVSVLDGPNYTLVPMAIFTIVVCLFLIANRVSKSSLKWLLYSSGSILFLNFIIFPVLYVIMIRIDNTSFIIDYKTKKQEEEIEMFEINEQYHPEYQSQTLNFIEYYLGKQRNELDTDLEFLYNENLLKVGKYSIYKTSRVINAGAPLPRDYLIILNDSGIKIGEIEIISLRHKNSLQQVLANEKPKIINRKKEYEQRLIAVQEKRFWTISKLAPYMTTIFSLDYFKPVSRIAHIVYGIHKLIVNAILLAFMVSVIVSLILEFRQKKIEND